jgi:predicted esterase
MTADRTQEYLGMWTRLTVLYDEGRMVDALEVVKTIERRFPERAAYMSWSRSCLHALMGDVDAALRAVRDAVERGWWWSEGRIADPDLDPVRDHPEFPGLMAEMAELRRRAHSRVRPRPEIAIFRPEMSPARAIVIALHMYGTTAEETIPYWRTATSWGAVVAVPESTLDDAGGAPCWDDDRLAQRDVRITLDEARLSHSIGETPVVLGGASQGAGHAIRLAMTGAIPACRAFIAVVGAAALDAIEPAIAAAAVRRVRGWMVAGEADVLVRRRQESTHSELVRRGLECRLETVPALGHWYPDNFAARLTGALDYVTEVGPE